jgi:hypothetical protein
VSVNQVNFVYGTQFDNSQLTGTATATVNDQTVNVAGIFTYTDPAIIGSVLGAGQFSGIGVTFKPNDATDFVSVQTNVTVTVTPATPKVALNQVIISFGTPLDNSQLSGTATAMVGGVLSSVAGTFAYTTAAGTVLSVGTYNLAVTFTPADGTDFTTVATFVQVVVTQPTTTVPVNTSAGLTDGSSQAIEAALASPI